MSSAGTSTPRTSLSESSPTAAQTASTSAHAPSRNTGPSISGKSGSSSYQSAAGRCSQASAAFPYASSASAMGASTSSSVLTAGWSRARPSKITARIRALAATFQCADSAAITAASGICAVARHGAFRVSARCSPPKNRSPSESSRQRGASAGMGSAPPDHIRRAAASCSLRSFPSRTSACRPLTRTCIACCVLASARDFWLACPALSPD